MEKRNKLEKFVLNEKLCSGCGTCVGVCPRNCIYIGENGTVDKIDMKECINCDMCYKCCPSVEVDFPKEKAVDRKYDSEIGEYISFFRGYACDAEIRKNGASGGMATALLAFLLKEKVVDKVVCADFNGQSANYRIVSRIEELFEHQKSYYVPVPLNVAIQEMKKEDFRYAVVGTPCQLQGLDRAANLLPTLRERIIVKIGLFCGYIQQLNSINALAQYLSCEGSEWKFMGWRCGDYPGYAKFQNVETKEEKSMIIYDALSLAVPFHTVSKCFVCPDGTNEFSDISLGDIHAEGTDENIGILRTELGKRLVTEAMEKGYLHFVEENEQGALYNIIRGVTASKRRVVLEQINLRKKRGQRIPEYHNLNMENNINPIIRVFMKRKAKMYEWSLSDEGKRIKSMQNYMKIGKYIYHYPESSWVYKMMCRLRSIMR